MRVEKAATIPVTGLCTPGAEAYAGQQISYLQLADGQSITLSLADCNPDFGARGPGRRGRGGVAPVTAAPPSRGPTVGGNCPATGTGGAGGTAARRRGGAGGDTTMGRLSTDAGTDPGATDGGGGCGCLLSGRSAGTRRRAHRCSRWRSRSRAGRRRRR